MSSSTGFFWILTAGAIFGTIHSLLASHTVKQTAVRLLGASGQRYYRLFFVAAAVPLSLIYVGLIFLLPDQVIYLIPYPWSVISSLFEFIGLAGLCVALFQTASLAFLGLWPLLHPGQPEPEEKLITTGLFRYLRHPIYTFTILFLWFSPRMTWNLLAFNIGITLYLIIGSHFEEQKLHRQFGEEYARYASHTPRFIPRRVKR